MISRQSHLSPQVIFLWHCDSCIVNQKGDGMPDWKFSPEVQRALDLLFGLAPHVSIVQHAPGTIQLRIAFSALGRLISGLGSLTSSHGGVLNAIPGVKGYTVSAWSLTATVDYDPLLLPPDLWDQLFANNGQGDSVTAVQERLTNLLSCRHSDPEPSRRG